MYENVGGRGRDPARHCGVILPLQTEMPMLMLPKHNRYDYSAIGERKDYSWPGGKRLARFMSGVFPVRPQWRERLAAITHVDGTARVQVLEPGMAPRLHALLKAYGRLSGIPILLNTSFNLAGEPIVNRSVEGYLTFRRSGIDVLVAGQARVTKKLLEKTA